MTRRRRRLLIVSAVLVAVVASAWWWTRPNLDPRFVGRWREQRDLRYEPGNYEFKDDGVLVNFGWNEASSPNVVGGEFNWRVNGDRLILNYRIDPKKGLRSFINSVYWRVRNFAVYRFQIVEITSDRMVLRACNDDDPEQTETTTYFRTTK